MENRVLTTRLIRGSFESDTRMQSSSFAYLTDPEFAACWIVKFGISNIRHCQYAKLLIKCRKTSSSALVIYSTRAPQNLVLLSTFTASHVERWTTGVTEWRLLIGHTPPVSVCHLVVTRDYINTNNKLCKLHDWLHVFATLIQLQCAAETYGLPAGGAE